MDFRAAVLSAVDAPGRGATFPGWPQLYLDGKLILDDLISSRAPLEHINDGFAAMRQIGRAHV